MRTLLQYLATLSGAAESEKSDEYFRQYKKADEEFWESIEDLDQTITKFRKKEKEHEAGSGI